MFTASNLQCGAFFSLLTMLLFIIAPSQHRWREKVYVESRRFLILGIVLSMIHFAIHIFTGWRDNNPELANTLNIVSLCAVGQLYMSSVYHLIFVGHIHRPSTTVGICGYLTIVTLIAIGLLSNGRHLLKTMQITACIIYFFMFAVFLWYSYHQYKQLARNLENYYDFPSEEMIGWTYKSVMAMSVSFMCIPCFILAPRYVAFLWYFFMLLCMFKYQVRFMGFGIDVHSVVLAAKNDTQKAEMNSETKSIIIKGLLKNWIYDKGYAKEGITIDSLAKELGVQKISLQTYINNNLGMTFRQWLIGLRLNYAKHLLRENPKMTATELATRCGITVQHLRKTFQERNGMSLSEWRTICCANPEPMPEELISEGNE